jgi:hypothetical protein
MAAFAASCVASHAQSAMSARQHFPGVEKTARKHMRQFFRNATVYVRRGQLSHLARETGGLPRRWRPLSLEQTQERRWQDKVCACSKPIPISASRSDSGFTDQMHPRRH